MPLVAGQLLSFYEILGSLGAGGMGEVYRGRDTRLEREVAIKVLPEELAGDAERLRRFEREARTLASLNHPNVAGIHGVDQEGDTYFLALELVPGEDLAARLARGRLPVDEAIEVCRQVAEGLEAAHEAGVVHRDLKPANVRITPDGVVKILDFGLAKPTRPEAATDGATIAESDSFLLTAEGMVLGTPTYMSPEQARGKLVDRRTDIWAFGCVLHECLTGKRAFEGEAFGDLVAAILEREVDLAALPPGTPPRVRELIARCLVKDPRRRLRDIGEARVTLEPGGERTAAADRTPATDGASRRRLPWSGVAAAVVLAAFAGWGVGGRAREPAAAWSQFTQLTDLEGAETGPALSPDGASIAYASRGAGSWDVYVQRVGGRNPIAVAADPERDEVWPAFSPDGGLIAYNVDGGLGGIWVVGATGESNRRVTDFGFNPDWSPDGEHIVFASKRIDSPYERKGGSVLLRVPAAGGTPVPLTTEDAVQPAWSPLGKRIAFWFQENGQRDLATVSADSGERVVLLDDAPLDWSPTWSADGRYLYFSSDRGGSMGLWRLPVDEASGRAEGAPEPVANGLEASMALPRFSRDGRVLAFRSETVSINPVVIPFDPDTERAGQPRELLRRTGILRPTSVSPDGAWLALYNRGEQREDIFVMRTDGSEFRRLTDDVARDRSPAFSPDGTMLLFHSNRGGNYAGYSIRVDGSALTLLTDASMGNVSRPRLEPGGERLLLFVEDQGLFLGRPPWPLAQGGIVKLAAMGGPQPTFADSDWSPDGRRISAIVKQTASGSSEQGLGVYDPASGKGRLVCAEEGPLAAQWLPDSRRVLYFTRDCELVVLDVETAERRVIAVDLPYPTSEETFAVAPDGTALYYGAERVESNIWIVQQER